jgi:putative nucleotidyltransferase with HDIG domain
MRFPHGTWGDASWVRALREKRSIDSNEPSTIVPAGHLSIRRNLAMPILFQGEVIGLFEAANRETDYTEADLRALAAIAEHVAPLLDARLRRERADEELAESAARLVRQAERIARTLTSVVDVTSSIVELRDPYTAGHQRRVSELAGSVAESLGMSGDEIGDIRVAGLLHDIGKAGIPTEILTKPGALSPIEFKLIKGHAEAGYRLAVSANMAEPIAEMIYEHHERLDGSGYPRGLTGAQTLFGAKVLAVADVVEAMMSHRPYRPALGIKAALAEIKRGTGTRYDTLVAQTCVRLFNEEGFKFSER